VGRGRLSRGRVVRVEDEGDTFCLYLARWAARSTPFAAPSATRIAVAESASEFIEWDVAVPTTPYEADEQDCFFISALLGTASCKAWLIQEDLTVYLSVTLASPVGVRCEQARLLLGPAHRVQPALRFLDQSSSAP